jgi:hypothetical protein
VNNLHIRYNKKNHYKKSLNENQRKELKESFFIKTDSPSKYILEINSLEVILEDYSTLKKLYFDKKEIFDDLELTLKVFASEDDEVQSFWAHSNRQIMQLIILAEAILQKVNLSEENHIKLVNHLVKLQDLFTNEGGM